MFINSLQIMDLEKKLQKHLREGVSKSIQEKIRNTS